MEASRLNWPALAGLSLVVLWGSLLPAAEYRTPNFIVYAPTDEIARQIGETAEQSRRELALAWLGRTLPNWYRPCPIRVTVGSMGAGGATTFTFDRGEVSGWNMRVQGSLERLLDSVVPHEVNHTIFASHFRRPLPRWADEGAATLIEHVEERKRQEVLLDRVIRTSRRIPLDRLLTIAEYPSDMHQVYTLYAEGYSLANFLVQQHGERGRAVFLKFLQDAHERGWAEAIRRHYPFQTVAELEQSWTQWVLAGSPPVRRDGDPRLASAEPPPAAARPIEAPPASPPPAAAAPADDRAAGELLLAALPPLPPLGRPLRQPRGEDRLNAPTPGQSSALIRTEGDRGSAELSLVDLTHAPGRVVPRRDPPPGFSSPLPVVSQQWMQRSLAAQRTRATAAARPTEPAGPASVRGQSPDASHGSQISRFPLSGLR